MKSFDIVLLFNNILVSETIEIIRNKISTNYIALY